MSGIAVCRGPLGRSRCLLISDRGTWHEPIGYRRVTGADRGINLRTAGLLRCYGLDLDPVIARPDGAFVVDARVKVASYAAQDPFLRKLR